MSTESVAAASVRAPLDQWERAFLGQAREELEAAKRLVAAERVDREGATSAGWAAVFCMLMQMCFEKLGKAALARSDRDAFRRYRHSHRTGTRLVAALKQMRGSEIHFRWKAILPLVTELERSHPSISREGPHLEYPWEASDTDGRAVVRSPGLDLPIAIRLASPSDRGAIELIRLAETILLQWSTLW